MRKHFTLLLTALLLMTTAVFAASGNDKKRKSETTAKIVNFDERQAEEKASKISVQGFVQSTENVFNGTPTGLSGFYDYQCNGAAVKYISVNPSDGNKIHVTYMLSTDSASANATRRAGYAYSSDGGVTWNSITSVTNIREGFPSLTILNPGSEYLGVVAMHNQPTGNPLLSRVAIDGGEGLLSFSAISPQTPTDPGSLIWPYVTASNDGSKMWMMSSFSGGPGTVRYAVFDTPISIFGPWSNDLATEEGDTLDAGGRYNIVVSASGNKVTMYHLGGPEENYISFSESTDGGVTFPAFKRLTKLTPSGPGIGVITTATDSIAPWIGVDAVYRGEDLNFVFSTGRYVGQGYQFRGQGIWFWSQATGFVNVVDTTKIQAIFGSDWTGYVRPGNGTTQTNHFPIDYPTIGVTPDNSLHCVFTVARKDTADGGRNYYTIAYTKSVDGGVTWSAPRLLENNAEMDFRYPSIAEFNPSNDSVNVVYQQDAVPGSSAFGDNAPISRAQLLFQRIPTAVLSTREPLVKAQEYRLAQNYPNPFNPTTNISYVLPKAENVSLKIYDVLGREVATLVNEVKAAGAYTVPFNASNLASGVYFYRLQAGSFVQTKKMMLVK
ncbi:MAG: T9SS type A sorting domain-containing protein [Chlorobiales bacterium]